MICGMCSNIEYRCSECLYLKDKYCGWYCSKYLMLCDDIDICNDNTCDVLECDD